MKNINSRQKQLLAFLKEQSNFVAAKKIAQKLGVTNKVIYQDIDELNEQYAKEVYIEKVPRKGIILREMSETQPVTVTKKVAFPSSVAYRRLQIMKRLLIEQKSITYNELATLFSVDQESIQNDLATVEAVLLGQHIHFISGSFGTRIIGNEADIQTAIFSLVEQVLADETVDFAGNEAYLDVLNVMYESEVVEYAQSVIRELIQANRQVVTQSDQQRLLLLFTIFLDRIQRNKHMTPNETFFKKLDGMELYLKAGEFLRSIQHERQLVFIPNDIEYVSSLMVQNGIDYGMYDITLDEDSETAIQEFIESIATASQIDLSNDMQLVEALHWFVPQMVKRLQGKEVVANPLCDFIKEEYARTFLFVQEASQVFAKLAQSDLSDDDRAYLTIFVQATFERIVQPRNILLVSPLELISSEDVYDRVHQVIGKNDRLELGNLQQLYHKDIENVDYIISSVVLDSSITKPIIYISALVTDDEIEQIAKTLASSEQLAVTLTDEEETLSTQDDEEVKTDDNK